ncbi:hypothetical protein F5Y10DRAFT_24103 [Nemania abortiva]|nr:hypothetical protein F5Y10DRAFT_24103 [Nemania abortiva]
MPPNTSPIKSVDADEGFSEGSFTPTRPPQYNDSNQPPKRTASSLEEGHSGSGRTATTPTIVGVGNETTPATIHTTNEASVPNQSPVLRAHILYHVNRDYDGAMQPLTERAVAALNNQVANETWNSNLGEWMGGGSHFWPASPTDINMSVLGRPQASTVAGTGTGSGPSWTIVPEPMLPASQAEHVGEVVSAAGDQFAQVSACPKGDGLLDEDFE